MNNESKNDVALEVILSTAESFNVDIPNDVLSQIYQLEKENQFNPQSNTVNQIKKIITDTIGLD